MSQIKRGVSLYSFQHEYAVKKMSLEDIFRALKEMGAQGVEILSDQMIHGAPHPKTETVAMWKGLMEGYGLEPICNDIFVNSTLYRNRRLTIPEQVELLKDELRNARVLGFSMARLVSNTDVRLIEPVLPLAEDLGVTMALEIHAGMSFTGDLTREYLDLMKKRNHPLLGLVLDMGILCARHPRVATAYFHQFSLSDAVVDYVDAIFASGSDPLRAFQGQMIPDDVRPLLKNKNDEEYIIFSSGYENTPLSDLDEWLPYIKSIHGKCYEMTVDNREYSICYPEIIAYLKEKGWSGYIATEYEGNRFVPLDCEVNALEQVGRHQEMLKELCGEG